VSVQAESAFQAVGAARGRRRLLADLSTGREVATDLPAAGRLLAQAALAAARLLDASLPDRSDPRAKRSAPPSDPSGALRIHRRVATAVRGVGIRREQS